MCRTVIGAFAIAADPEIGPLRQIRATRVAVIHPDVSRLWDLGGAVAMRYEPGDESNRGRPALTADP
jgi:hypothetical protein